MSHREEGGGYSSINNESREREEERIVKIKLGKERRLVGAIFAVVAAAITIIADAAANKDHFINPTIPTIGILVFVTLAASAVGCVGGYGLWPLCATCFGRSSANNSEHNEPLNPFIQRQEP